MLKAGFIVNLQIHHVIHGKSKITITPEYLETEKIYVTKIVQKTSKIYV